MIIGVDGNEANVENRVGTSVYTFELLNYFKHSSNKELKFIIYLRTRPNNQMPHESEFFTYRIVPGPFAWLHFFLPINLFLKQEIDVFFSPAHYIPRFCPCPVVVTIHDLSYIYFPQEFLPKDRFKLINWTNFAVNKAVSIIAVSKNTAKDATKHYHLHGEKLHVVQNGFRQNLEKAVDVALPTNIKKPFILFVSTLQPRKNLSGLLQAFSKLDTSSPQYNLVVVGKKGWLFEKIFKKVKELRLEKKVIFTDFIEDSILKSLYKNASLLVLPGFYEGFGYPMLEAMYFGCPVASSRTGALTEVGGDAVLYFDPQNPEEMAKTMQTVLKSDKIKAELIKKGHNRVKEFSWEDTCQRTLEVILNAIQR